MCHFLLPLIPLKGIFVLFEFLCFPFGGKGKKTLKIQKNYFFEVSSKLEN